jgi:integrase
VATLYKRGTAYYLNWRKDGRQLRRSLGEIDRRTAEALRAEKEAELHGVLTPTRGITVEAIVADYLRWYKVNRPDTYGRAASALKPLRDTLGHYAAEGMPANAFELWAAGRPPATTEKALKLARSAFKRAVEQRIINRTPMQGVKVAKPPRSREPHYFRPADLVRLAALPRGPLWIFMASTGLRRGEMAKATRADARDGLLRVESTAEGRTKSGKWRAVPLSGQAKDALKALGKDRLVSVHKDTLSDWFRKDADALGLKGTLHSLRHTFCTALVQAGVSLHEVKRLAGHSSITVTEQYAHHAPDFGRDAIARMDGWMAGPKGDKLNRKHSRTRKTPKAP